MAVKYVLSIAGSDSSAGAGIQSDLKTFHNHGVYGLTAITSITAQNTQGVQDAFELPPVVILSQLKSLFADFDIKYIKTGMLSSVKTVEAVYDFLKKKKSNIVVDPVILSKNNYPLLITPNIAEAEFISDWKIRTEEDIYIAAKVIHDMGVKNVLIKGGHLTKEMGLERGTDILFDGKYFNYYSAEFVNTKNTHGIGCTFSASVTANLALGKSLNNSIINAKKYITSSLTKTNKIGKGYGPVEQ
jgi:hydroxymethylpyrimidine/phosphomethylpyrimidine kinase